MNFSPLLNSHCADNHPTDSPVSLCVSFWDVMASAKDQGNIFEGYDGNRVLEKFSSYAREVDTRYISRPNYRRIDGRPVLFFGGVERWKFYEQFDVAPQHIVECIREVIPDAYLVGTNTAPEFYRSLKGWGLDAVTEYLWYSDSWQNVVAMYRQKWSEGVAIAKETDLDYWVPATSGYDSEAWRNPVPLKFVPTPEQFKEHLIEARAFASRHAFYTRNQVIVYSWNEFGEQRTPIEPTQLNGDAYLQAVREAAA